MHYPPETTSIMLLVRILAYIKQHPDPATAAVNMKQFCHRTINEDAELMHKLLGDQFKNQLDTLRELTSSVISGDCVQEVNIILSYLHEKSKSHIIMLSIGYL